MNLKEKIFLILKKTFSDLLVEKIDPISKEIKKLLNDKNFLDKILLDGCKKLIKLPLKKLKKLKKL